jgi:hypothetical protein
MVPKEAKQIAGGLSAPSKMPGFAYGLPAQACVTGRKLAETLEHSVCTKCYAHNRGNYRFENVKIAQNQRLTSIKDPKWVEAMVTLIGDSTDPEDPYFRWHDSGDLQDDLHFEKICQIAEQLPNIYFWLPTQERAIVKRVTRTRPIPENLVVRFSDPQIGMEGKSVGGYLTSGVAPRRLSEKWHLYVIQGTSDTWYCPAHLQGNECGHCRRCWDSEVKRIVYLEH